MDLSFNQILNKRLITIILFFSVTFFFAPTVSASQTGEADVGIAFRQGENEIPPHDNTLTAGKVQPNNKRVNLPNTGETVKQLTLLISGMILIVLSFTVVLDKQVKANSSD